MRVTLRMGPRGICKLADGFGEQRWAEGSFCRQYPHLTGLVEDAGAELATDQVALGRLEGVFGWQPHALGNGATP